MKRIYLVVALVAVACGDPGPPPHVQAYLDAEDARIAKYKEDTEAREKAKPKDFVEIGHDSGRSKYHALNDASRLAVFQLTGKWPEDRKPESSNVERFRKICTKRTKSNLT